MLVPAAVFAVLVLAPNVSATPVSAVRATASATERSIGRRTTTNEEFLAFTRRVPSFSRQTKLPCSACHSGFPALNAFGRLFKLNGYTMTGLQTIDAQHDSASRKQLQLSPIAPLAVMAVVGGTKVAKPVEGTNSFTAQFPQQLSLFAASAISPRMGIFSQLTYTDQDGTFSIDNVDVRYAGHHTMHGQDVLYGLTLNNNPTVQDVWNTTPAWGFPFISSEVAPSPAAATKIEGAYGQAVAGLGAYALVNNMVYAEVTGYVAAPQGAALPLDSAARDTPRSVSPYWRVALQHQYANTYVMVGAFGLDSHVYPTGVSGMTDHYRDVGFDAQIEQKAGEGMLIGRASVIQENQSYTASFAAGNAGGVSRSLHSYHANLTYQPNLTHSLTAGTFAVSGSSDDVLYPPGDVTGSATGRPNSSGMIFDANANAWLNVRLGAQYIAYSKFNGSSSAYDVRPGGRSAHDNNTLYLYLWLAF